MNDELMNKINSILDNFLCDASDQKDEQDNEKLAITMWIPKRSKHKYNMIQNLSKRKFSKSLNDIVVKVIDSVDIPEKPEAS